MKPLTKFLGLLICRDPIAIPFWRQWAFKWSTPSGIDLMVPGLRIYCPSPKLPKGTIIHLTAGRWASYRFYQGQQYRWLIKRQPPTK